MNIKVDKTKHQGIDITITCDVNYDPTKLIDYINSFDTAIMCEYRGEQYMIDINEIYYIECIADEIYINTCKMSYTTKLKLYELENILLNSNCQRISKSVILNTNKVLSVKTLLNTKIEARLINNQTVVINRTYIKKFKERIGM